MRRRLASDLLAAVTLLTAGGLLLLSACTGDLFHDTTWADATSTSTGTSATTTTTGAAPSCDETLSPREDACVTTDALGVFVRSEGDDAAAGTRDAPVKTLARALALAAEASPPKRVFACAQAFEGAVTVPAGVALHGGLDCLDGTWGWIGDTEPTTITAGPDLIPVTLAPGAATTVLEDLAVTAEDAEAPGGSSIALLADGVTAILRRCDLTAGDGMVGAPGAHAPGGTAADGVPGVAGNDACVTAPPVAGGPPPMNVCGGMGSIGGAGGAGGPTSAGGDGAQGEPIAVGTGLGGLGEPASGTWAWNVDGKGTDGAPGIDGEHGGGATLAGTLTAAGLLGAAGAPGIAGAPGQGGGGGGGSKGIAPVCPANQSGAGGGSGGTGGCGGAPGLGGQSGGASIALASVDAKVTLLECALVAGAGGAGGPGGKGQPGGEGAPGGNGGGGVDFTEPGGPGGSGGKGGRGGNGGGGRGGHSLGIAYSGEAVTRLDVTIAHAATPAAGGLGGDGVTANAGAAGLAADVQPF